MSKITIDRALIDRVLEVLTDSREDTASCAGGTYMAQYYDKAISALREALAQPQQEPVFWYRPVMNGEMYEGPVYNNSISGKMLRDENPTEWVELYTSPPARSKPLSDEEAKECLPKAPSTGKTQVWFTVGDAIKAIRSAEAAHGIKDTP